MKTPYAFSIIISLMVFSSCIARNKKEDVAPVSNQTKTTETPLVVPPKQTLKTGTFTGYDHSLAGKVTVIKDTTSNIILRLENYTMTEGPDVDVYLSKTSSYSSSNVVKIAHLDIGYSNSTENIDIDNSIDLATYKYVIVWCNKYSVLFGYTELK